MTDTTRPGRRGRQRVRRGLVWPIRLRSATARLFAVLAGVLVLLCASLALCLRAIAPVESGTQIPLSDFVRLAGAHQVLSATFYDFDHRILGTYAVPAARAGAHSSTVAFWTGYSATDSITPLLYQQLTQTGTPFAFTRQDGKADVQFLAQYVIPLLLLADVFGLVLVATRSGEGLGGLVRFGRIGGQRWRGETGATFTDVAGADQAVTELCEVRDYLRDPARFAALGARPPKGVLLVGPPGCGKTLLARAIAGEAQTPFFSISGAEFVESLVGIGAARVRDLFRQVRTQAPAIVFIDELDAAGRRRGGLNGGQEEREQTLNQLLIEMDGFDAAEGIVVIAATNRPDILDPALLRPGRFDRQITVEPPDVSGRRDILALHARHRPTAGGVDFAALALRTPGFTGADLANVINEAALLSVRVGHTEIGMAELDEAVLRVIAGPQRRGHLLTPAERTRVAYHESGHAVIAAATGRLGDLHRLSIMARDHTIGHSAFARRLKERAVLTRSEVHEELVMVLGGTVAEEIALGEPSTGSRHDLVRATELAQTMAGIYGMSDHLGKLSLLRSEDSGFLGDSVAPDENLGEAALDELHGEVRRLVAGAERMAHAILAGHRDALDRLADRLALEETLDAGQVATILSDVARTGLLAAETEATVALEGESSATAAR